MLSFSILNFFAIIYAFNSFAFRAILYFMYVYILPAFFLIAACALGMALLLAPVALMDLYTIIV